MRGRWTGLGFLAPLMAFLAFFVLYPLGRLAFLSMSSYDGFSPAQWVGTENFSFLADSPDFHRAVRNTAVLMLGMPIWIGIPFVLAALLFGGRRAGLARTVLLIPALLPAVVIGSMFRIVLSDNGPVTAGLDAIGLGAIAPAWLSSEQFVLVTVMLVIAWGVTGSGVMFYSAGLSAMPTEQIEAAILDGAKWRHLAWHIYRPALAPVTRFWTLLLILSTVTSFFPWIFSLTRGGPGVASTTIDYAVYVAGLREGRLGLAAAMSVIGILFVALTLVVVAAPRAFRKVAR